MQEMPLARELYSTTAINTAMASMSELKQQAMSGLAAAQAAWVKRVDEAAVAASIAKAMAIGALSSPQLPQVYRALAKGPWGHTWRRPTRAH